MITRITLIGIQVAFNALLLVGYFHALSWTCDYIFQHQNPIAGLVMAIGILAVGCTAFAVANAAASNYRKT